MFHKIGKMAVVLYAVIFFIVMYSMSASYVHIEICYLCWFLVTSYWFKINYTEKVSQ